MGLWRVKATVAVCAEVDMHRWQKWRHAQWFKFTVGCRVGDSRVSRNKWMKNLDERLRCPNCEETFIRLCFVNGEVSGLRESLPSEVVAQDLAMAEELSTESNVLKEVIDFHTLKSIFPRVSRLFFSFLFSYFYSLFHGVVGLWGLNVGFIVEGGRRMCVEKPACEMPISNFV